MKIKLIGLVALAFAFTLMAAQRAVADGIHDGHDSDVAVSTSTANMTDAPVHADLFVADTHTHNGLNTPTFDHVLAYSSPVHDCGCDSPPTPAPEPSSLILMAAGLTPFLWIRRKTGA